MHDAEPVRTARGSLSGFDAIFDRHADGVHDLALAVTGDRDVAVEIMKATFHEARPRLAGLTAEDRLRVWLLAVARRQAAFRAGPTAGGDHPHLHHAADPLRDRQAELVWRAVAQLPPLERTVLNLQLRQALEGRDLTDALGVDVDQLQDLDGRVQAIDRGLARHLVASTNDGRCSRLARLLDGWDGRFALEDPCGISSHVGRCRTCTQASTTLPPPLSLYTAALTASYPPDAPRPVMLVLKVRPDGSSWPEEEDPAAEPAPPSEPAALPPLLSPSALAGPEVSPPADGLPTSAGGEPAAGSPVPVPADAAPPVAVGADGEADAPPQPAPDWIADGFPPRSFLAPGRPDTSSSPVRRGPGRGRWLAAAAILAVALLVGTLLALTQDDQKTALRSGSTSTSAVIDAPVLVPEATTLPTESAVPPTPAEPASIVPVPGTPAPVAPSTTVTTPGAPPGSLLPSLEVLSIPTVDLATGPGRAALPLRNTGSSPLTYATRSSFGGLSVDRPTGTIGPGATIELIVTLDGSKAPEGGFSGTLTFDGSGGTQQVTVASKVGRRPVIRDDAGESCTLAGVACSRVVQLVPGSDPDPRPTLCNTPWRYSVTVEDESRLRAVVADSNLAGRDAQLTKDGAPSGTGGRWQSQVFPPLPVATSLDVSIQAVDEFDFSSARVERNIAC